MTIEIGLVGLGFGEKVLLPALRRVRGVRVAGIASAHPEKTRAAARRLGIPWAAQDWRELVDDPRISAIALAVPPSVQYAVARRAISLGKPVFCEKPLAVNRLRAEELARLAARKRIATAVDFEFPELDAWRRAKELLQIGSIGTLREMQVTWNVETYAVKHDLASWKTEPRSGGGALNNFVSHSFHYIEHFLGPVRRLSCRQVRARGLKRIQGETGASLWLETRQGVLITAAVATHAPGEPEHRIVFIGNRGKLTLENRGRDYAANFGLTWEDGKKVTCLRVDSSGKNGGHRKLEDGRIEPVSRVIRRWAEAVRQKQICRPGFAEGARAQRLIEAARSSDRLGRPVFCG